MKNNFSKANTPKTNKDWTNKSEEERIKIISKELKKDIRYEDIEIKQALKNGQIVLRTEKIIPANERGLFFLELEEKLKLNIDEGITIWCEPVGDKSKLRNLRGVVIKT
jgi:hypothetical protein